MSVILFHISDHVNIINLMLLFNYSDHCQGDWPVLGLCGLTAFASRSCLLMARLATGRFVLPARDTVGVPPPLSRDITELLRLGLQDSGLVTVFSSTTGSSCDRNSLVIINNMFFIMDIQTVYYNPKRGLQVLKHSVSWLDEQHRAHRTTKIVLCD